ncbi:hypothetical protein BvCmsKKP002_04597 [Escherichia coli]|nr:hypothetical protein BvCmsKKP002_04597 [Escherichia coli]
MFAVFGLLNFDAPHGIPFIVSVLPLFRKLIQSAGVILRQIDFFQQLLAEMRFGYLAFEKIQITFRIIARPTDGLHECRFANSVHTADIKVIIMARFDIDTGGYPVQPRAKVAGCGFNLPDIGNPLFREPELKLYRRVIHRKTRDRCYLKIARCQLNPRRRCRCGNPERYRCRIALLSPRIYRPDCQPVVPRRQLREAVCGFCRPGRADQPLTAVIRCHGQAKQEAHALHHPRRVPFRLRQILAVSCAHLHRQVLHCRRDDAVQGAALVAVKVRSVIHDGFFFRYVLHRRDGKGAVRVFPDGDTAEQATTQ